MDIAKIQLEVAKLLNITVDVLTPNNKELKGENSTRR
jgi:hypothetical protein